MQRKRYFKWAILSVKTDSLRSTVTAATWKLLSSDVSLFFSSLPQQVSLFSYRRWNCGDLFQPNRTPCINHVGVTTLGTAIFFFCKQMVCRLYASLDFKSFAVARPVCVRMTDTRWSAHHRLWDAKLRKCCQVMKKTGRVWTKINLSDFKERKLFVVPGSLLQQFVINADAARLGLKFPARAVCVGVSEVIHFLVRFLVKAFWN